MLPLNYQCSVNFIAERKEFTLEIFDQIPLQGTGFIVGYQLENLFPRVYTCLINGYDCFHRRSVITSVFARFVARLIKIHPISSRSARRNLPAVDRADKFHGLRSFERNVRRSV